MSHALQVNFRRLTPDESLVSLAQERYRQIRTVHPGPGECRVSLVADEHGRRSLAHASVQLDQEGRPSTEASAAHPDPHVALSLALNDVQAQLGMRLPDPSWQVYAHARGRGRLHAHG